MTEFPPEDRQSSIPFPSQAFADMPAFLARRTGLGREIKLRTDRELALVDGRRPVSLEGRCGLCGKHVTFTADWQHARRRKDETQVPNWRERLVCPCGINSRLRAALHFMKAQCGFNAGSRVYLTEQASPFYDLVRGEAAATIGSEFLRDRTPPGQTNRRGIRHEDVTRLSFADAEFDIVGSFDVLEHVPDYPAALREMARVLRPGGSLVLTAPFLMNLAETLVRARPGPGGKIEHLLPPEYHGDPQNPEGVLCYYQFGWDLLDRMREAGFAQAWCHLYWSWELGYLDGMGMLFHAVR